jgi:hypothetical protein
METRRREVKQEDARLGGIVVRVAQGGHKNQSVLIVFCTEATSVLCFSLSHTPDMRTRPSFNIFWSTQMEWK